ncbi:MAG: ABC transporter ATP-binding protein [Solirubrobacteraceae bacterium]
MLQLEARTRLGAFALDVACEVRAGQCLALAGPSGAGKSTLLRVVAGLLGPEHGRVSCRGEVWLDTAAGVNLAPERRCCGYVFQDYALFGHLRVWQNVAYALRGGSRAERRTHAHELLERFGISRLADARPDTLSGGERQRVALARALARAPSALLLDEPLSALDARTRARAARELGSILREIDVPTVLVTHDFSDAALFGDEVAIIDSGRVIQQGSASELAAAPTTAFVADFTGAVVLTGTARAGADGLTTVELDGGGSVTAVDPATGPVAVSLYPWEITIEPAGTKSIGSAQNHLPVEIISVTSIGNRVRIALAGPQALAAEITEAAARELALAPGLPVIASWKATATRLVSL